MSNEAAPVQPVPVNSYCSIIAQSRERIKTSGTEVVSRLVNELVDIEVQARVKALREAVSAREVAEKTLNKIQPDQASYDANGNVVSNTFSKAKLEELRKAKENLKKIDEAIDKAVMNGDFSQVKNIKASPAEIPDLKAPQ